MGKQTEKSTQSHYVHSEINDMDGGYESLTRQNQNGSYALTVAVGGVHCAACIQKIESALNSYQAITRARLNFTSGKLSMEWNGHAEDANIYVRDVQALGYPVRPYDEQALDMDAQKEEKFLLACLGIAGFAMGNIMLLSVGLWTTTSEIMGMVTRDFLHMISACIAIPTILFSGRPFFRSAFRVLRAGHTNMDVPISIALVLACGISLFETFTHGEHAYFDSAVMLTFFLLIGRYLDFRVRKQANAAAVNLLDNIGDFAMLLTEEKNLRRIPVRDIRKDMFLRIAMGERFPVDGIITDGQTSIDTSLVTGESIPHTAEIGDTVHAGTLNMDAPVIIKSAGGIEQSLLSDVVRLMETARQGQAKYIRIADKAARLYTPVVHTLAATAFLGWVSLGGMAWQDAMMIAVTVLIITCPCALGLAVPVVQVLAGSRLMRRGILLKSGDALERLAKIDTVIFDKTGTITQGQPVLKKGSFTKQNLKDAAALAAYSNHPLARALTKSYTGKLPEAINVKEHAGQGISGTINGQHFKLGSRTWCGDKNAPDSQDMELFLKSGQEKPIRFSFTDDIRPDVKTVLDAFRHNGLRPILLSGDRLPAVQHVANICGFDTFYAEQTPTQKFSIMEELRAQGHVILMVGDGLNDAPVLAGADVSIAPGSAIHLARNTADILFMGDSLKPVLEVYKTARKAQNLVRQNFILAILYNIMAVPLAMAGYVTPLIAAIAMSGSSLIVILNAFKLKAKEI